MGKHYTDDDPLHGHGKAVPKPKRPNPHGSRLLSNFAPRAIPAGQLADCCWTDTCRQLQRRKNIARCAATHG